MGLKGDIVLVNFDPVVGSEQAKVRPAIIIQNNTLNKYSNTTIVVPISSRIYEKTYPMHVAFSGTHSLKPGTIKTEQIRVIDKQRIHSKIGSVNTQKLQKIGIAIQHTLGYY